LTSVLVTGLGYIQFSAHPSIFYTCLSNYWVTGNLAPIPGDYTGTRGIGGSVVDFSPIMQQARVRFPATGCSAGPKPGKMGGLRQEGHLA
ncbi:hypothetical protein QTP70_020854, partial [Hemibagrus guttatus]